MFGRASRTGTIEDDGTGTMTDTGTRANTVPTGDRPTVVTPIDRGGVMGEPVMMASVPARGRAASHGLLIFLLGVWGAGVAYAGPVFHYGPARAAAWQWTTPHTVLNLLPGLGAMAAGLLLFGAGRGVATLAHRMAALLALGSGAWFVLGRTIYPIFYGSSAPAYGASTGGALANFVTVLGYGLGVGIVLSALGGILMAVSPHRTIVHRQPRPAVVATSKPRRGLHLRNTDPAAI